MNEDKIILDLCGGTGSWSQFYKNTGYDVRIITLPGYDVLTYKPPKNVYGVLAAPPCTDFSIACTQYWKDKDNDGRTEFSLKIVNACLRIIEECQPKFWALENPIGRLYKFIGRPVAKLNYLDFGCSYSKYVCLWGKFNIPLSDCGYNIKSDKRFDQLTAKDFGELPADYIIDGSKMNKRAAVRSITYPGFAKAFFLFNQ